MLLCIIRTVYHFVCMYRGFCYFNNVALAAKSLTSSPYVDTVLVLDWVSGFSLSSANCMCALVTKLALLKKWYVVYGLWLVVKYN